MNIAAGNIFSYQLPRLLEVFLRLLSIFLRISPILSSELALNLFSISSKADSGV